jgi:L-lactate dehydrogenase complex protein LldG
LYEIVTATLKDILRILDDEEIHRAIRDSVRNAEGKHLQVLKAHPYLEELARRVRSVEEQVLGDLEYYIDQAMKSINRNRGRAYLARDAVEARRIILDLARDANPIVLSKSMVAEEIRLREALEEEGHEVWETDLGQLLIQLEGSKPMHTTAPALHMTVERARRLVEEKLGLRLPENPKPEDIVAAVRGFLREKFVSARLGISGANGIAADTGTIVLVENEGNIRLTTSLPPVHIVLTGVDKIVPTLPDAISMALVQAAYAGLYPPTYVNLISGPSNTADIQHKRVYGAHGPRELHVVLLDNGRIRAAREEPLREQLYCIRCGRCQWECPVWQQTANAWGGPVYGGPMGMGWTAITHSLKAAAELSLLCLGCGRCDLVCPVSVPLSRIIRWLKARAHSSPPSLKP